MSNLAKFLRLAAGAVTVLLVILGVAIQASPIWPVNVIYAPAVLLALIFIWNAVLAIE